MSEQLPEGGFSFIDVIRDLVENLENILETIFTKGEQFYQIDNKTIPNIYDLHDIYLMVSYLYSFLNKIFELIQPENDDVSYSEYDTTVITNKVYDDYDSDDDDDFISIPTDVHNGLTLDLTCIGTPDEINFRKNTALIKIFFFLDNINRSLENISNANYNNYQLKREFLASTYEIRTELLKILNSILYRLFLEVFKDLKIFDYSSGRIVKKYLKDIDLNNLSIKKCNELYIGLLILKECLVLITSENNTSLDNDKVVAKFNEFLSYCKLEYPMNKSSSRDGNRGLTIGSGIVEMVTYFLITFNKTNITNNNYVDVLIILNELISVIDYSDDDYSDDDFFGENQ